MSYYLERVQQGVDYIEQRLDEDVGLGDVAKAAGISQWHFQRIFKSLTGETLKTYIRARRLAASLDCEDGARHCYGVIRHDPGGGERLEYPAAIEVTDASAVPAGMVSLELPAASYATFEHRGRTEDLDHTVSYAYGSWLAGSAYRHSYGADLEIYGAGYIYESPDSVIHYAMPVAT